MAAVECTAHGFEACYNVQHGFEGDLNSAQHRNSVNGWRMDALPWQQT